MFSNKIIPSDISIVIILFTIHKTVKLAHLPVLINIWNINIPINLVMNLLLNLPMSLVVSKLGIHDAMAIVGQMHAPFDCDHVICHSE